MISLDVGNARMHVYRADGEMPSQADLRVAQAFGDAVRHVLTQKASAETRLEQLRKVKQKRR